MKSSSSLHSILLTIALVGSHATAATIAPITDLDIGVSGSSDLGFDFEPGDAPVDGSLNTFTANGITYTNFITPTSVGNFNQTDVVFAQGNTAVSNDNTGALQAYTDLDITTGNLNDGGADFFFASGTITNSTVFFFFFNGTTTPSSVQLVDAGGAVVASASTGLALADNILGEYDADRIGGTVVNDRDLAGFVADVGSFTFTGGFDVSDVSGVSVVGATTDLNDVGIALVPEPTSALLLSLGSLCLLRRRR